MIKGEIKGLCILFCILLIHPLSYGQLGGNNVFKFVNIPNSARITGLGGQVLSVLDNDIALTMSNPAALNKKMDGGLSFQQNYYFSDSKGGFFAYGQYIKAWDVTIMGGMQFMNYGQFDLTDVFGNTQGEFSAAEWNFTLGAGKALNENYHVGANLRYVASFLESYRSAGLLGNISMMYINENKGLVGTLLFKNIGGQLTTYNGLRESVNFEILASLSKRLNHLPFRYSIIYHHLNRWNILYDDPDNVENPFFNVESSQKSALSQYVDNFFRHFIINGEFLIGPKENFNLRIGYNHFRRKELVLENTFSLAGFSFGFGMKVYRFKLDYGYAVQHRGANIHHLGISTYLSEFKRKKSEIIRTGNIGELITH